MRAVLIDDEQLALNYLEHQLLNITDIQIAGKFTNPMLGKEMIEKNDVEIVFLDIQLPNINGVELAEKLLEVKPELQIVFVTAYNDFAIKAFELNALDYVLKPISKERLTKTIERIRGHKGTTNICSPKIQMIAMNLFQQVILTNEQQKTITLNWRTTKAKLLFLYLVHRRNQIVSKSEIIELLWEEYEPKKAFAQLYTTIYHIRKTLEHVRKHFIIKNISDGYLMKLENVKLDVVEFEQFIYKNQTVSEETIQEFEQAIRLFKGDYLQGYDFLWLESERHRLQLLWITTAIKMVDWYSKNNIEKAINLSLDICNRYPLVEEAYFLLMKIYALSDRSHAAVHYQYRLLKTVLKEELDVEPSPQISEWYNNWIKKNKE